MAGLGWQELVIVLVIVIIIFGAGRLPEIGGALGKSIKEFRANSDAEPEIGSGKPGSTTTTTYKSTDARPTETREVRADEI
jgi:sec-independent protein translocase protein TatA